MDLREALDKRGYAFRQHLEEEGWTRRKLTVVDLDAEQKAALRTDGVEGLRRVLARQGRWSFPALEIDRLLPRRPDLVLSRGGHISAALVVPASNPALARLAKDFADALEKRFRVRLPVCDDEAAALDQVRSQHLLLFGGAHENRIALDLALRYQTGFVDAAVPGRGGWVVTTHAGLDPAGYTLAQVAADPACHDEALACLLNALARESDRVLLRGVHRIVPGPDMAEHLPSWEDFTASLPGRLPQIQGPPPQAPQDPVALADLLAPGLDSGGPDVNHYNVAPIDIAVECARYYQLSGEPRALQLFRELLFRLADYYLKTPDGASYPADLDFRIGHLVLYYARLEHAPVFSEEDRLILASLLLSCVRSCYEYALKMWPVEPGAPTRHNHETFPARSLLYAADYFGRYGLSCVRDWLSYTEAVFSGGLWTRFKQRENANTYEQTAFEHAACYSAFTGRRFDLFGPEVLRLAATRQVIASDNFLRPVDYGDTGISLRNRVTDILAGLATCQGEDPVLAWYAREIFSREHHYLPSPLHGIPGLRRPARSAPPPARVWERMPLDPRFLGEQSPGFPEALAFDLLAFRTGWADDDFYLLFEGVGNKSVSHSHNEVNGIVRLNHLGRHWIVSNGYGRRAGLTNVSQSFSTRVLGPDDHNMLVLRKNGEVCRDLPVCNALLQQGQSGDLAFATGALLNYGGTDWYRTLLIWAGRFVLVLDRVRVAGAGLEAAHIEWNALGRVVPAESGFRLDQQGVFMDVSSPSGWAAEPGVADQSADWKRVLESGAYPYATFPLSKLTFHMPGVEPGRTHCLATLLAATRAPEPDYRLSQPEPGRLRIEARAGSFPDLRTDDRDLSVRADGAVLEIRFAEVPALDLPIPGLVFASA